MGLYQELYSTTNRYTLAITVMLIDVFNPLAPGYSTIRTVLFSHDMKYTNCNAVWSPLSLTAQTFSSVNLFINYGFEVSLHHYRSTRE
jgi:hypothetical protein